VEGTDSDDLAIPDEDKKISQMVIEFTKRSREDTSTSGVELNHPLNLVHIF
jgi:hypothetical protein